MKKFVKFIAGGFVALVVIGAIAGGTHHSTPKPTPIAAVPSAQADPIPAQPNGPIEPSDSALATTSDTTPAPTPKPKPKPAPKPAMTDSQRNAVSAANDYLATQAFSKQGLIDQLSSSAGDGYPKADAVFAVNHIKVDWNEQAVKSARDYLNMQSFSKQELIDQLSSSSGEGFTPAQAEYAVSKVY
jgi:hypothetical protein